VAFYPEAWYKYFSLLSAGRERKSGPIHDLPEQNNIIREEEGMGLKRKQILIEQQAYFEHRLKERLSYLSGKGVKTPQADKDTLARKLQADIRAVKNRLRVIADNEKRAQEVAKLKQARAAAPQKEQEGGKSEKPKKAPEEGKGKKAKPEKKAAPPKPQEAGKTPATPGSSEEGKPKTQRPDENARKEPAGQPKSDKESA
jgi:hypothetical protein